MTDTMAKELLRYYALLLAPKAMPEWLPPEAIAYWQELEAAERRTIMEEMRGT